jgi:hypothetical protein
MLLRTAQTIAAQTNFLSLRGRCIERYVARNKKTVCKGGDTTYLNSKKDRQPVNHKLKTKTIPINRELSRPLMVHRLTGMFDTNYFTVHDFAKRALITVNNWRSIFQNSSNMDQENAENPEGNPQDLGSFELSKADDQIQRIYNRLTELKGKNISNIS